MNTDELFQNFGLAPQAFESKQAESSRKVVEQQETAVANDDVKSEAKADPTTLESFLATFATDAASPSSAIPSNHLLAALAPTIAASASGATAVPTVAKPTDVLPSAPPATPAGEDEDDDEDCDSPRVTGAKRLKMMGAGTAEIEEE
jgi:hypothetical protein